MTKLRHGPRLSMTHTRVIEMAHASGQKYLADMLVGALKPTPASLRAGLRGNACQLPIILARGIVIDAVSDSQCLSTAFKIVRKNVPTIPLEQSI